MGLLEQMTRLELATSCVEDRRSNQLNYICILNRLPYLYIYSDYIDQHLPYLVLSFFRVDIVTFYSCAGIPIDTRILVDVA